MADVFISYKREDRERAREVAEGLEAEGLTVWWDTSLVPGDVFDHVINGELAAAGVVVVLWSPLAIGSMWVRGEAKYALDYNVLIPACIADCRVVPPFNLLETSDLVGWRGDRTDPRWRRFVAAVVAKRKLSGGGPRPEPTVTRTDGAPAPAAARTVDCAGVPLEVVWVPPGKFRMGATKTPGELAYDALAEDPEGPVREVTLTRGFWLGKHPVTVAQYRAFCAATGHAAPADLRGRFAAPDLPVTYVDWNDARAFAGWLTTGDGLAGALPTEAEWEYAARGTDARRYPWGSQPVDPSRAVWLGTFGAPDDWTWQQWHSNKVPAEVKAAVQKVWAEQGPKPVGGRPAGRGPFGAEDQAGNVWEWCQDAWGDKPLSERVDPCRHGDNAAPRVIRGGSWCYPSRSLRAAYRDWRLPVSRLRDRGFRVLLRPAR